MNVFPFTPRREFMKTQQLPVILKSHIEITVLSWYHSFWKAPFSKCFPSTLKRKVGVSKFLPFDELFRAVFVTDAVLSVGVSAESHFSGEMWTRPDIFVWNYTVGNKSCEFQSLGYFTIRLPAKQNILAVYSYLTTKNADSHKSREHLRRYSDSAHVVLIFLG